MNKIIVIAAIYLVAISSFVMAAKKKQSAVAPKPATRYEPKWTRFDTSNSDSDAASSPDHLNFFCSAQHDQCRFMHSRHLVIDANNIADYIAIENDAFEPQKRQELLENDALLLHLPPFSLKDRPKYEEIHRQYKDNPEFKHSDEFQAWKLSRFEKKERKVRFVTNWRRNAKTGALTHTPHYSYQVDDHEVQLERQMVPNLEALNDENARPTIPQQSILFSPHMVAMRDAANQRFINWRKEVAAGDAEISTFPHTADAMSVSNQPSHRFSFPILNKRNKDGKGNWLFSDIEIWRAIYATSRTYLQFSYNTFRQNCGVFAYVANMELTGTFGYDLYAKVRMRWLKTVYHTVAPGADFLTQSFAFCTGGKFKHTGVQASGSNVPIIDDNKASHK
jgi:hypothetical protein